MGELKKSIILAFFVFILISVSLIIYFGHKNGIKSLDKEDFLMGTVVSVSVYGSNLTNEDEQILTTIKDLEENKISWRNQNSEIYFINQELSNNHEVKVEEDVYQYLKRAYQISKDSDEALCLTIHPIIDLWGIEKNEPKVPKDEDIKTALNQVGDEQIKFNDVDFTVISSADSTSIDLGSIGKGLACDKVYDMITDMNHISGATVAVGGSILVYGEKPDHSDFKIGIKNPIANDSSTLGYMKCKNTCYISTSGDYEKYFVENDIRYHHIFDSKTGYPSDNELTSVTIICDNGLDSDGLSTACFVLGMDKSKHLLKAYNAEAIFVTKEKKIYVTNGIYDDFVLTNEDFTVSLYEERK